MDYFLIFLLWLLGVGFDVMSKVIKLKNKFPQFHFGEIWVNFFNEEWDSLFVSFLVLFLMEVAQFIIVYNEVKLPSWVDNWGMYGIALVLSYSGQRLAYKWLGTAEQALSDKADELKNKV